MKAEVDENSIGASELENRSFDCSLELKRKVSALVFSYARPISSEKLAEVLKVDSELVDQALIDLEEELGGSSLGFSLEEVAGGWQLRSRSDCALIVQRLIPPKAKKLSKAAAETLAVIAYQQPVGRAEIESIRGVDALPTLKTLLEAKLIRTVGKQDAPGNPALYGTTQKFLEKFGLRDLSDLPEVRDIEEIELEPGEAHDAGESIDSHLSEATKESTERTEQ